MKPSQKIRNKKRRQILDFARDNKLVIHPGCGFESYVDSFYESNACPCDKTRLDCPCDKALGEVEKQGWCRCRLYWRDLDTYKKSHVPEE